jgi:hypothetical protein
VVLVRILMSKSGFKDEVLIKLIDKRNFAIHCAGLTNQMTPADNYPHTQEELEPGFGLHIVNKAI